MEIRLHGRGGQGGVTCAKILAAMYARMGRSVQSFGDYAGERSGAPVRAYTRVSDGEIINRNKVYLPDHVLVLDATLLGQSTVAGLAAGGTLLIDSAGAPDAYADPFGGFRLATVNATAIAASHHIGTRSVVIVNTTIAGAFARVMDISLDVVEQTYAELGFTSNFPAARAAYEGVRVREADATGTERPAAGGGQPERVVPLTDHRESPPTGLQTGTWRAQTPRYVEGLAPCNAWCPAGNDVVGFVQALAKDDPGGAAAILGRSTPLAATCGRVCPAPCMEGCNRAEHDGAVNIRELERWTADRVAVAQRERAAPTVTKRFAIVGGGPAGLAAAYELARAGHRVTIYELEQKLGGVLRTGIPSYRLPREVLDREIAAILALGVEVRTGRRLGPEDLKALSEEHDAVIVATGLQRLRGLDVEGVELGGVEQGIRYLHRVNLEGGAPLSGHVVVLGGGNTAMDCARSALRSGAERVTVAYRRTEAEMPAIREEVEEAEEEGVVMLYQRQPFAFQAEGGRVAAVELAEVEMGEPDAGGRRRPIVTNRAERLPCEAVLLALGQSQDDSMLPSGWTVEQGRVLDEGVATNVFAAGDLATGDGTVTHAIGSGRRAAGLALRSVGLDAVVFERPDRQLAVPATEVRFDHFPRAATTHAASLEPGARVAAGFVEVRAALADAAEARRCFSCGHCTKCDTCLVFCPEGIIRRGADYEVDYSFCKGCGICVAECPRSAMEMVQAS